jgi:hypothetical protein
VAASFASLSTIISQPSTFSGRRGKVVAEKNLNGNNDRERRNNHHSKRKRHEPYPA